MPLKRGRKHSNSDSVSYIVSEIGHWYLN